MKWLSWPLLLSSSLLPAKTPPERGNSLCGTCVLQSLACQVGPCTFRDFGCSPVRSCGHVSLLPALLSAYLSDSAVQIHRKMFFWTKNKNTKCLSICCRIRPLFKAPNGTCCDGKCRMCLQQYTYLHSLVTYCVVLTLQFPNPKATALVSAPPHPWKGTVNYNRVYSCTVKRSW